MTNKLMTLDNDLQARKGELAKALPSHIQPERFIRTTITGVSHNPDVLNADRQSLMTACMKAAQDGLILDGREAALVVRAGKAVYQPMVAGITKLVRNSGQLASLTAQVVYAADKFSYNPASGEAPQHEPDWFGDRGEPIGVYAVARLKDGTIVVEVMSRADVLRIGKATPNAKQYDPASGQHYGEWWRKTVIRRISKYLPKSTDLPEEERLFRAIEREDEEYELEPVPQQTERAPRTRKRAAEILNAETVDVDPATGEIIDAAGPVTEPAASDIM